VRVNNWLRRNPRATAGSAPDLGGTMLHPSSGAAAPAPDAVAQPASGALARLALVVLTLAAVGWPGRAGITTRDLPHALSALDFL
jgi:hypothetical protein